MAESHIDHLAQIFAKLPGLGPRSARRAVLYLLTNGYNNMRPLGQGILDLADSIVKCEQCGNLDTVSPCAICTDERRDQSLICVVEEVADLWALERNNLYKGLYHVLGGTLSAVDGRGPEQLGIEKLVSRVKSDTVKEVIIATNATVDGQNTAHYIAQRLADSQIKLSRLAHGIPVGGELDYLDEGTLGAALNARQSL